MAAGSAVVAVAATLVCAGAASANPIFMPTITNEILSANVVTLSTLMIGNTDRVT